MSNPPKQQIIKAVGELGRRVTVADVAAKTGQSLQSVAQVLNVLASESNATLEVTETGEIFYCYRPNFYYAHLAHGFARVISVVWDRVLALFYLAFRFCLVTATLTAMSKKLNGN